MSEQQTVFLCVRVFWRLYRAFVIKSGSALMCVQRWGCMTKACLSCVCVFVCARCLVELREWNAAFLSSASAKTSLQSIKSGMLLQHTNPHVRTHSHVACDLHEPSPEISIRLRHKHTHMQRQQQLYLHYSTHTTMQWNSSSFVLGPFRNTAHTHTHTTPKKKKSIPLLQLLWQYLRQ